MEKSMCVCVFSIGRPPIPPKFFILTRWLWIRQHGMVVKKEFEGEGSVVDWGPCPPVLDGKITEFNGRTNGKMCQCAIVRGPTVDRKQEAGTFIEREHTHPSHMLLGFGVQLLSFDHTPTEQPKSQKIKVYFRAESKFFAYGITCDSRQPHNRYGSDVRPVAGSVSATYFKSAGCFSRCMATIQAHSSVIFNLSRAIASAGTCKLCPKCR